MIRGISIQNFMSYVNVYVPLKNGLNLICGPNGAGKSSILLAISLVLGQTYVERARKLSDLVRWGQDEARLTLTMENKTLDGKKLFPKYRSETIDITRVLKKRADYYYLINGRIVNKGEIVPVLKRAGLNPDNTLIVMHQLMLGKFGSISPQDKLKMFEEAVRIQHYRESIIEAYHKLKDVMGEEEKLLSVLESTEETREYWRREYEKLLKKKSLEEKVKSIRREIAWSKVNKKELTLLNIDSKIRSLKESFRETKRLASLAESDEKINREKYKAHLKERRGIEDHLLDIVKIYGTLETLLSVGNFDGVRPLANTLGFSSIKEVQGKANELEKELKSIKNKMNDLEQGTEEVIDSLIGSKVKHEIEEFKLGILKQERSRLEAQREAVNEELKELMVKAEHEGPRIEVVRSTLDLMLDLNSLETMLKPLLDVSEEAADTYLNYSKVAEDLKDKSGEVKRNREEVLKELSKRRLRWRTMVEGFLSKLEDAFNKILKEVGGEGKIRITDPDDFDKSGLDILVGFKGVPATSINALTQSGGERSIALMAFLLALQRNIQSPFRAIDEFDVHLDPKNRDLITQLIISSSHDMQNVQQIAITPGKITLPDNSVNVIVVQNIEGVSTVTEEKPKSE